MNEFIKELDQNLDYLDHEMTADKIIIYVASNRKMCKCPYCETAPMRVHSCYEKSFKDLPIMKKIQRSLLKTGSSSVITTNYRFITFLGCSGIAEKLS